MGKRKNKAIIEHEYLYETKLETEESFSPCGYMRLAIINHGNHGANDMWLKRLLGQRTDISNYVLIGLHITDCDDFGGASFYAVPQERYLEICNALVNHAKALKERIIQYDEFFDAKVREPSFEGIKSYDNW